jgi:hypothetical protein
MTKRTRRGVFLLLEVSPFAVHYNLCFALCIAAMPICIVSAVCVIPPVTWHPYVATLTGFPVAGHPG